MAEEEGGPVFRRSVQPRSHRGSETVSAGGYEHRHCSWLPLCPRASCVPAFLMCKMGRTIMPASQGSSVQAHSQLVGILVQLLFPVTGVCSDWRVPTIIVKYFNQHPSYGDKRK